MGAAKKGALHLEHQRHTLPVATGERCLRHITLHSTDLAVRIKLLAAYALVLQVQGVHTRSNVGKTSLIFSDGTDTLPPTV